MLSTSKAAFQGPLIEPAEFDIAFQHRRASFPSSTEKSAVIVCHCTQATDRTVRAAAAAGCRTADEVAAVCDAGACCRGCRPLIQELLDQSHAQPAAGSAREHDDRRVHLAVYASDAHAS
jgi:bacterioferritin-associated ferredoxin